MTPAILPPQNVLTAPSMTCMGSQTSMCTGWRSQMVSLLHMAEITEEGVHFQSNTNGARMLLTPEHSIAIQNQLGPLLAAATCAPACI